MTHRTKAAAGWMLFLGSCGGAKEDPPAPTKPAAKEAPPKLHFEPAESDHTDVARGETVTERVVLVAEKAVDWRDVLLSSSCECLTADFVGTPTPTRADVQVTIFGKKLESGIDGAIDARDEQNRDLAKPFIAHVDVRRRPFVEPREVFIEKGPEGRFELIVGQAFKPDAERPPAVLNSTPVIDETKLTLLGMDDVERERDEENVILRETLHYFVAEEARAQPFTTEIALEIGEPPVKRTVKVHWPGK